MPDGRFMYVSQYSMYGDGFYHEGTDACSPSSGIDKSYVYRVPLDSLKIDKAIKVGAVPKFLAVTPDQKYLLVSNWCSYTLSVVDVHTSKQIESIYLGPYPRGIAVDPESRYAYVAVMGSYDIARVDLSTFKVSWISGVGSGPRHLCMAGNGKYLYATLNARATSPRSTPQTRTVVDKVYTGQQPRSMTIAPDGKSLYVVNYDSSTMTKVRTSDMKVIQTVNTNALPIGITYDAPTKSRVGLLLHRQHHGVRRPLSRRMSMHDITPEDAAAAREMLEWALDAAREPAGGPAAGDDSRGAARADRPRDRHGGRHAAAPGRRLPDGDPPRPPPVSGLHPGGADGDGGDRRHGPLTGDDLRRQPPRGRCGGRRRGCGASLARRCRRLSAARGERFAAAGVRSSSPAPRRTRRWPRRRGSWAAISASRRRPTTTGASPAPPWPLPSRASSRRTWSPSWPRPGRRTTAPWTTSPASPRCAPRAASGCTSTAPTAARRLLAHAPLLFEGIERADSFIVNPHKWLYAPFDCAAVIYRDGARARQALTQEADYLDAISDDAVGNPSDLAIHLTRRPRGLPLWASVMAYGTAAYTEAVDHCLDIAEYAAQRILATPDLELALEPALTVMLFRRRGWSADDYTAWSEEALRSGLAGRRALSQSLRHDSRRCSSRSSPRRSRSFGDSG